MVSSFGKQRRPLSTGGFRRVHSLLKANSLAYMVFQNSSVRPVFS
ncbi:hypothetical protein LINGRAHAP2_LOCUS11355, partial [Linum grandiflorum]